MNLVIPVYEKKEKPLKNSRNVSRRRDVTMLQTSSIKTKGIKTTGKNKLLTNSTDVLKRPRHQQVDSGPFKQYPPVLESIKISKSPILSSMSDISSLPSPLGMPSENYDDYKRDSKDIAANQSGSKSIVDDAFDVAEEDIKKIKGNKRRHSNQRPVVRIEEKYKVQEDTLVMKSFNCCMLPDNRQVTFNVGMVNPYDSMKILSYDSFPIIVKDDDCLIRVEVSICIHSCNKKINFS